MFIYVYILIFLAYICLGIIYIMQRKKRDKQLTEKDLLNIELSEAISKVKYNNKIKQMKLKIKQLNDSNVAYSIAEQIASQIIVQIAEQMVENDKESGKLDELYSENNNY